jgi:hypothetical protein
MNEVYITHFGEVKPVRRCEDRQWHRALADVHLRCRLVLVLLSLACRPRLLSKWNVLPYVRRSGCYISAVDPH